MRYIIGADIGTTHIKAVIATEKGDVLNEYKLDYPTFHPSPGYHEQNADDIFKAVLQVLKQVCDSVTDKQNITCISFSAAMHSLLAVDKEGKPLTAMMTWADTRSNAYALQLKHTAQGNRIYKCTGTPLHPMLPLFKIAWIREQTPEIFTAAFKFISIKEYIFYHLFGEYVVDYSIASATGLFDILRRQWCDNALKFAGISSKHLSAPVSSESSFGVLKKQYRLQLGLPEHTFFLIGASDGCLANIGAGAVLPGELALTIGTSGAIRKLGDRPVMDTRQSLFNYVIDDKTFLTGGAINNGGIVLKWFISTFMDHSRTDDENIAEMMEQAATIVPGCDGLIFLPYLYGERAPIWDGSAKGVFLGISSLHTKAHFMRAVLEGICFSFLQIMKIIEKKGGPVDTIYANGGFIQSALWLQIMTDVLNKKIKVSYSGDASAMGAVFMAMRSIGEIKEWKDIKRHVKADTEFFPDATAHQSYIKNFAIYEHLYDKLKSDFVKIDLIQSQKRR